MCDKNKDKLQKRARRKYINTPLLGKLSELDSILQDKYKLSFGCSSLLQQIDGKVKSKYCKRMWCSVCAPIRTAVRLNNYSPQLDKIGALDMTTLTLPNVPWWEIASTIKIFRKIFKQFRDTWNKRNKAVFKGVYNFEVTYNNRSSFFHPHIHIIHSSLDKESLGMFTKKNKDGEIIEYERFKNQLIEYWLKNVPSAKLAAQDTRICDDYKEGFKYQSKSVYYRKDKYGRREYYVPYDLLDKMYIQLRGVRCFNSFGIEIVTDEIIEQKMNELTAYITEKPDGTYIWRDHDWYIIQFVDTITGEVLNYTSNEKHIIQIEIPLTNYKPSTHQKRLHDQISTTIHD